MKLVIMFCDEPRVEIRSINYSVDNVEEYIEDELGYNINDLSWQTYEEPVTVEIC